MFLPRLIVKLKITYYKIHLLWFNVEKMLKWYMIIHAQYVFTTLISKPLSTQLIFSFTYATVVLSVYVDPILSFFPIQMRWQNNLVKYILTHRWLN